MNFQSTGLCHMAKANGPEKWLVIFLVVAGFIALLGSNMAFGQVSLPGTDQTDKLEAAGTLLRIIDTGLFQWMSRIMAGLCIMSGAWALKEQRFGISVLCIVGAILFGTAPQWVKQIFNLGGNQSIFSLNYFEPGQLIAAFNSIGVGIYV